MTAIFPAALAAIRAEIEKFPGREIAFRCAYDAPSDAVASAVPIAWGSATKVPLNAPAMRPGDLYAHIHPRVFELPSPSDQDVAIAEETALLGLGFAVLSADGEQVYIVTRPQPKGNPDA